MVLLKDSFYMAIFFFYYIFDKQKVSLKSITSYSIFLYFEEKQNISVHYFYNETVDKVRKSPTTQCIISILGEL